jgi:hypothetical protein
VRTLRQLALSGTALVLLLAPAAGARDAAVILRGNVGPGFTISLVGPDGQPVRHLDPGSYQIQVADQADIHDFHLVGPGVDMATSVEFVGSVTWDVTLTDGTYRFLCDPHQTLMNGSFGVGTAPPPPPPPPPPSPPPAPAKKLVGTVGPGASISLRTASGAKAGAVAAGRYSIQVRDRSAADNFHLIGKGVSRKTGVAFRGTATWRLTLGKGVYRYRSDAHPRLGGTLRVR